MVIVIISLAMLGGCGGGGGGSSSSSTPETISTADRQLMWDAVHTGTMAELRALLAAHPNLINAVDSHGSYPIHYVFEINYPMAKLPVLIDAGADVNAVSPWNYKYPLMCAAHNNDRNAIRLLVSKGANLNLQEGRGYTALRFAVDASALDAIDELLNQGADASITDTSGNTPYSRAQYMYNGSAEVFHKYGITQ